MIHISQIYSCSEVSHGSELYYICELGKYSMLNYSEPLSLKGVVIQDVLNDSEIWQFFRLAVYKGWLVDVCDLGNSFAISDAFPLRRDLQSIVNLHLTLNKVEPDAQDIKNRAADIDYAYDTPKRAHVGVKSMEGDEWVWHIDGNGDFVDNNSLFNRSRGDQTWLSFLAMLAIQRFHKGYPKAIKLEITNQVVLEPRSMSYLLDLLDSSTCFTGWVRLVWSENITVEKKLQLGYVAWYTVGRDRGLCKRFYNGVEKFRYMQEELDLRVGDLCLFYTRNKEQRNNYMKSIDSCHIAKITRLTKTEIGFELINTMRTYYHGKKDFYNHPTAIQFMYTEKKPFEALNTSTRDYSLADIGVGYLLYGEQFFIVPLDFADDTHDAWVSNSNGEDHLLLPQNDFIYWVLEDYDYEYNKDRFLKRYFSHRDPARTRYLRGEQLEDWMYLNEEG